MMISQKLNKHRILKKEDRKRMIGRIQKIPFIFSLLACLLIILQFGFDNLIIPLHYVFYFYLLTINIGIISLVGRYLKEERPPWKAWIFDIILFSVVILILIDRFNLTDIEFMKKAEIVYASVFFILVREFSSLRYKPGNTVFNPAQIFVLSFLIIIIIGTLLLMLPNSTKSGISLIDALFSSTSAVCVTGLIVVDTGTYFTNFGQIIILILIQLGGIGIMTFTSYFSYFFKGGATYQNQLILKEMTNSEKLADVFKTMKKIILLTFIIEGIGAGLIYMSLENHIIKDLSGQIFFSVFHSISGFCNAGFSTLSDSLYDISFRFNYPLHLIIAALFIIGGIGFPILFNFYKYLKYVIVKIYYKKVKKRRNMNKPWVINLNTRIVVLTTILLMIVGTIGFYILEYDNTLAEHNGVGKIVTAFFGAVTPRTAGFNSVDTGVLSYPTLLFIIFLMWVGASPASTGGGVKTSTFAISIINVISLARGKNRAEFMKREIAETSVRRAFSIMILSILVIGIAIFIIKLIEKDLSLMSIAFECFSAFSTVGLSHGITNQLSEASKLIIILVMFIGRISMLTLIIAMVKRVTYLNYRYPTEEILIN